PGARFSVNRPGDPSNSSQTLQPEIAGGVNSVGNPMFANQPPAPLSTPMASGVQSDWSIVGSPNINTNAADNNFLEAATCVSAFDCWAVGLHVNRTTGTSETLIE